MEVRTDVIHEGLCDLSEAGFIKICQQEFNLGSTDQEKSWLTVVYNYWSSTVGSNALYNGLSSPADVVKCLIAQFTDTAEVSQCLLVDTSWCRHQVGAVHGCLLKPPNSHTQSTNHNNLHTQRVILLGKLTSNPESMYRKASDAADDSQKFFGTLYLQDSAGIVPCEICSKCLECVPSLLESWVILTSWNLVCRPEGGVYIEMCDLPLTVGTEPQENDAIHTVSVSDASLLLNHKEILKTGLVNVMGEVLALSEMYRVKKDMVFTIQLSHDVIIIVKKPQYLYWQKLLSPRHSYIFTNLRATTLTKGAGKSVKVFVPWTSSQVIVESKCVFKQLDVKEWLRCYGGDLDALENLSETETAAEETEIIHILGSYQGVVTSDDLAVFGYYTLDQRVGLYVNCVPTVDSHKVRVGSVIAVHNAHIYRSKQIKTKTAPHRKMSEITILNNRILSYLEDINKGITIKRKTGQTKLQQMIWKYGLSKTDVDSLIEMVHVLMDKFQFLLGSRGVSDLVDRLLSCGLITVPDTSVRSYIQEFVSPHRSCCITKETENMSVKASFPVFEKLNSVLMDSISKTLHSSVNSMGITKSLPHTDSWSCLVQKVDGNSGKIIVGILELSSGRVKLTDQTGSVDCVITSNYNRAANHLKIHRCHLLCSCADLEPGSKFRCPYIHPCCQRRLIAVNSYYLVQENYVYVNKQLPQTSKNHKSYVYLQFSMENALLLCKNVDNSSFVSKCTFQEPKKQKLHIVEESCSYKTDKIICETILLCRCETLMYENKNTENCGLRFCAVGYIIPNDLEESTCSELVAKLCSNVKGEADCGISVKRDEDFGNCQSQGHSIESNRAGLLAESLPSVIFLFRGKATRWYPVLYPGSLYKVITSNDEQTFPQTARTKWQLKRAINKAGGRSCIVIPESAQLQRIFLHMVPNLSTQNHRHDHAWIDIQSERCEKQLVNFICQIMKRNGAASANFETSDRNFGDQDGHCIKLQVCCSGTEESMDVYYNTEGGPSPPGLIPGAVVHFHNLERKVSRNGNVYCHSLSVSSFNVLQYQEKEEHKSEKQDMSLSIPIRVMADPAMPVFHYLSQLWSQPMDRQSTFQCICWVQKIVRVSLKYVCQRCGQMVVEGMCSNGTCDSGRQNIKFLARASFIAEDGTSVAMVSCRDAILQKLFMLSDKEWNSLTETVLSSQEIFIQQTYPADGTVREKFVYMLCDNPLVKRNWLFTLSNGRSAAPINLDRLSVDEFAVKAVDTGLGNIQTKCLPFLTLECHDMKEVDYTHRTINLLT